MRSVAALILVCAATAAAKPVALPTEYAGDRFYVTPVLASGVKLRCYTDSGGGGTFLFEDDAKTAALPRTWHKDKGSTFASVAWPPFAADAAIPPPLEPPYFIVLPRGEFQTDIDCFLGQSWFGGRTWMFDYPGKRLWWRPDGELPAHERAHEAALTFKKDGNGTRENNFGRIIVTIDGEALPLLLDTGATVTLSATALQAIGDGGPRVRAGSFVTTRTFDKWHKRHPDWRVLEGADEIGRGKLRMILVPAVTVGGYTVGPAWFAERPDVNFDEFMSGFMVGHVEGAIGGSALRSLRVTVDYARGVAVFEKP